CDSRAPVRLPALRGPVVAYIRAAAHISRALLCDSGPASLPAGDTRERFERGAPVLSRVASKGRSGTGLEPPDALRPAARRRSAERVAGATPAAFVAAYRGSPGAGAAVTSAVGCRGRRWALRTSARLCRAFPQMAPPHLPGAIGTGRAGTGDGIDFGLA